jgi:hypothetical protein
MGIEQSSEPTPRVATFYHTVKVEASETRFVSLETVGYLDPERLSHVDRARVPVGEVVTDCCRRLVHVIVENGMVTGIEIDQDEDAEPDQPDVDPEILEFVKAAGAALGRESPAGKLPIPFSELSANPSLVTEWWTCFRICIFGYCLFCCYGDTAGPWAHCSIERIGSRF